jgi:hypothetical protein
MGLQSGENGPKAVLKKQFSSSIHTIDSLERVTQTVGGNTAAVCVVADGNVMISGTPQTIVTLTDYVNFLTSQIGKMLQAANHVVVVFDEPASLTAAKKEEQALRDKRRATVDVPCSDDLPALPLTDAFDEESFPENASVRAVYNSRGSRNRIIDIISARLINHFSRRFDGCLPNAPFKSVTIDGVDPRGGKRPCTAKRDPSIISTSDSVADVLERDSPIGEGDQKLSAVSDSIRANRLDPASPFHKVTLVVISTIDTDSIAIELLSHARRTELENAGEDFKTILCFKERSQIGKRKADGAEALGSHFTAVDIAVLYNNLQLYLFSASHVDQIACIVPRMRLRATSLFALGAVMCGSDFTLDANGHKGIKGFRFDEVLSVLRNICTDSPHPLAALDAVFHGDDLKLLRVSAVVHDILTRVAAHLENVPRRKKNAELVLKTEHAMVKKCLWNLAYFAGRERKDTKSWGFSY